MAGPSIDHCPFSPPVSLKQSVFSAILPQLSGLGFVWRKFSFQNYLQNGPFSLSGFSRYGTANN
jgi:hypothetical protein